MNLAFHRDVACLMYFPPTGTYLLYGRFDDIWGGLVLTDARRLFDEIGKRIADPAMVDGG